MNIFKSIMVLWVLAGLLIPGQTKDIYAYSYGDPSPAEQYALELLNRARTNPQAEAALYNIDLQEGVQPGQISGNPVQPLAMNAELSAAAREHSQDMMDNNYFDHYSLDGRSPWDRITNAGYIYSYAGENLALRAYSQPVSMGDAALYMHGDLFVDDGVSGRGHRVNMLNENFTEVGISIVAGSYTVHGYTYPYSFIETCDFGQSSQEPGPFILGVVYKDTNGNSQYDPGEGLGGITVTVGGTLQTSTASAGGYAIPLYTSGTYDVTISGNGISTTTKSVTISNSNMKVDFIVHAGSLIIGDVNEDGNLTIVDALLVARNTVGLPVNGLSEEAADVNCDGNIDIVDALLIARKAVGLNVNEWCVD